MSRAGSETEAEPELGPMLPEVAYETDEGNFLVVIHVDDAALWPPLPGTIELALEVLGVEPGARTQLTVRTPTAPALDITALGPPASIRIDDATWRLDGLDLPKPTIWLVPIAIEQGWRDDAITLNIEVARVE